jgi:hypothetical protein
VATDAKHDHQQPMLPAPTITDGAPTDVPPMSPQERDRRELERLDELINQALRDPDPLRANLGLSCAKLLGVGSHLERAVRAGFERVDDPVDAMEMTAPAVRLYLAATALAGRLSSDLR